MKLSITTAWNEASAFVKQEGGTLFLIAFALLALPGIIFQVAFQPYTAALMPTTPGTPPDLSPLMSALPIFLLLLIPLMLLSMWGQLTISTLALRRETVIGSAFGHALRRLLPLLGAVIIWAVAVTLLVVPIAALMVAGVRSGHPGVPLLLVFALMLFMIFVSVRLLVMTPLAAAEPAGPVEILRRSWRATAGHFWKLFGFVALITIAFLVVAMVAAIFVGIIVTLVGGPPLPGSLSFVVVQLIMGVLRAVFFTYFVVTLARIYAQLSPNGGSVAQVFE
jgi:membrane-anchored glycerophosphoryl diester phosphodiesterase (GDPDase)